MARPIHSRTRPSSPCSVSSISAISVATRRVGAERYGASAARATPNSRASSAARATASAPSSWPGTLSASFCMRVEPLARAVAEPQIGIGLGDIGMRIDRPRRLQDLARLALLARFRQPPPGQRRRRHQIGRELDRFQHRRARGVAVDLLQRQRAGGQQHRALAAIVGLLQRALHVIERIERAGPVGGGAAIVEHRLSGPGQRRRRLGRFLGRPAARHAHRRGAAPRYRARAGRAAWCRRAWSFRGRRARRRRGRRPSAPIAR